MSKKRNWGESPIFKQAQPINYRYPNPFAEWLSWIVAATVNGLLPIVEDNDA
jgi:hypothetical protein